MFGRMAGASKYQRNRDRNSIRRRSAWMRHCIEMMEPRWMLSVVNDNFASRTVLSGAVPITASGSNVGATKEAGEPDHAGDAGGASVWWSWTAPTGGTAIIDTTGSNFDTLLSVYTGTSLPSLNLVAENDDSVGSTSKVTFTATAGTVYQIAVDGFEGDSGSIALHVNVAGTPANDNFASRTILSGALPITAHGTNAGASKEAGEPNHAGNSGGHSVWWAWTAPSSSNIQVDTVGSDFDTLLGVYTGSLVSGLTQIAANDQAGGNNTSALTFTAVAGTQYQIAVDGWGGDIGSITLHLANAPLPPANDNFASRTAITGALPKTVSGSTAGATREIGEPDHAGDPGGHSVWWSWTAPSSGTAQLNTQGSSFDTLLAVYTGSSVSNLTEVDSGSGGSDAFPMSFAVIAGTQYQIAIDGFDGQFGSYMLHLALTNTPLVSVTATDDTSSETPGNVGVFTFTRTGNLAGDLTVNFDLSGTASSPADYTPAPISIVIPSGSATATLTITPVDDSTPEPTEFVDISLLSSPNYLLGDPSDAVITILDNDQVKNDNFASRTILSGALPITTTGTNFGATKETGEPDHADDPGGHSVWWAWTAPSNAQVQIDTIGSDFDTLLAVYTGSSVSALTEIASDDQSGGNNTSKLSFSAIAGTQYQIAVDGWGGDVGNITLNLTAQAPPTVVSFPDVALETAVRDALGKPTGDITSVDMLSLTSLQAEQDVITNLEGLEYAQNLDYLDLFNNSVSDLSPLAGLTQLSTLLLSYNQVSDLTPLSGLANLSSLWLRGNPITDLTPLTELGSLNTLDLGQDPTITDFSPVGELTSLQSLDLDLDQISDLSPLASLTQLNTLNVNFNQINDLSPLSGLSNLAGLDVSSNQLSDVSPLAGLSNLTWLNLSSNQLTDISPLDGLGALQTLFIHENQLDLSNGSAATGVLNDLEQNSTWVVALPQQGQPANVILNPGATSSNVTVFQSSGQLEVFNDWPGGFPYYAPSADLLSLTIVGGSGNDTFDFFGPTDVPIMFQGGTGADTLNVDGGNFAASADLGAATSNLTVNVLAGATIAFAAPQHLASLSIDGQATVAAGGQNTLVLGGLSIGDNAALDLADNDLVLSYSDASPEALLQQYVKNWTVNHSGPMLMSSTFNDASSNFTRTLAVADNANLRFASFSGQTFAPGDFKQVLVKYTYLGDANLDGKVTPLDYAIVDGNIGLNHDWGRGDLNGDGNTTPADYAQIDGNIGAGNGTANGGPQLIVQSNDSPQETSTLATSQAQALANEVVSPTIGSTTPSLFSGVKIHSDQLLLGVDERDVWG